MRPTNVIEKLQVYNSDKTKQYKIGVISNTKMSYNMLYNKVVKNETISLENYHEPLQRLDMNIHSPIFEAETLFINNCTEKFLLSVNIYRSFIHLNKIYIQGLLPRYIIARQGLQIYIQDNLLTLDCDVKNPNVKFIPNTEINEIRDSYVVEQLELSEYIR